MSSKIYDIEFNGDTPFKALVDGRRVSLFREHVLLTTFKAQKVFTSPKAYCDDMDCEGCNLLLHIKNLDYVFISEEVYSFKALAPIKHFYVKLGNNSVPYTFAIDTKENCYLLTYNHVIIPMPPGPECWYDPYHWYDDGARETSLQWREVSGVGWRSWFRSNKWRDLIWESNAKFHKYTHGSEIMILYPDGTAKTWTKEKFNDFMRDFGNARVFQSFQRKIIARGE